MKKRNNNQLTRYGQSYREDNRREAGDRRPPKTAQVADLSRFFILPNNLRNKMRYVVGANLTKLLSSNASLGFVVNGLYDVDQRIASTAVPGFVELMSLYQNYRVDSCKVTCLVMNKEAFPVIVCSCFTGISHYATNNFTSNFYGNKFSKNTQAVSGVGGMDRCKIVNSVNMADLFGSTAYWGDLQSFIGTGATNPGTALDWQIGVAGASGEILTTAGVDVWIEFEFICEFSNLGVFNQ